MASASTLCRQSTVSLPGQAPGNVAERLGQAAFLETSDMGQPAVLLAAASPGGAAEAAVLPAGALTSNLVAAAGPVPASTLVAVGAAVPVRTLFALCYHRLLTCMQDFCKQNRFACCAATRCSWPFN